MKVIRSSLQITQDVLFALLLREVLTRFGNRRMGAFWTIFEPALHVIVMLFIFSVIRARSVPGLEYPIFLLLGMVPFFMMRNIAKNLMNAVDANQALFAYPNIKIFDTYVARTLLEIAIYITIYILFAFCLGFWLYYDVSIANPLQLMAALLTGIIFSFGIGMILSVLVSIMPNVKTFVGIAFMALYFVSGVIFPLWIIPQQYLDWLLWNPYAHIINNIREAAFAHYPIVHGVNSTYPAIAAIIALFLGLALYRMRKDRLLTK